MTRTAAILGAGQIGFACAHAFLEAGYDVRVGIGNFSLAIEWLAKQNPSDWCSAFPQLAAYPWDLFDYEAEDRFLAQGA